VDVDPWILVDGIERNDWVRVEGWVFPYAPKTPTTAQITATLACFDWVNTTSTVCPDLPTSIRLIRGTFRL
jgi:hypothetical protein